MGNPLGCIQETLIPGVAVSVDKAIKSPGCPAAPAGFCGIALSAKVFDVFSGLCVEGENMFG
ncbi:hypothetical protein D3C73_1664780 [compost metagenome]